MAHPGSRLAAWMQRVAAPARMKWRTLYQRWQRSHIRNGALAHYWQAILVGFLLLAGWGVWQVRAARGRLFMGMECYTLYGLARSSADSARVDSTIVVVRGLPHAVTCGAIRRDSLPPHGRRTSPRRRPA